MSRLNELKNQLLVKGHAEVLAKMMAELPEDHPLVLKQAKVLAKKMNLSNVKTESICI